MATSVTGKKLMVGDGVKWIPDLCSAVNSKRRMDHAIEKIWEFIFLVFIQIPPDFSSQTDLHLGGVCM